MNKTFAFPLGVSITRYLSITHALGRRFSIERRILEDLDDFMLTQDEADLTATSFEDWCQRQLHVTPTVRRNRMRIVRNFCLTVGVGSRRALFQTSICFPPSMSRLDHTSSHHWISRESCRPVQKCHRRRD